MEGTVAYLGPEGTFSQEAVRACPALKGFTERPYATLAQVFEAVLAGEAECGLVPIENSLEGSVNLTLDLLIHRGGLFINREMILPIRNNLLASEGTGLADIRGVISHPQPLAQCGEFIRRTFPGVETRAANSTTEAVMRVRELPNWAAIGTAIAAELYGLKVLARDIQDNDANYTRFVLLSRGEQPPTGKDKTSLACSLDRDRPGGLYEVLGEFALRGINLTKIESRPTKVGLGSYIFLIDCEGHRADPTCREALEGVRGRTFFFKLLGSYPSGGALAPR